MRTGEVRDDALGVDLDAHADRERAVAQAVLVDEVLGLEHAAGQTFDGCPRQRLAPLVRGRHRRRDVLDAVPLADLEQPALGDLETGRERREIADRHVGQAAVRADHGDEVAVELAAAGHADERQLQPLLEDLDGVGGPRARILAADLGPVALRRGERDDPAVHEDRTDHRDVGEVSTAPRVGIVRRHDVARREIGNPKERVARGLSERAEEPRDPVALRDELAAGVGEPDGEVEDLVDHRDSARFV
jgi:hypothetical protein